MNAVGKMRRVARHGGAALIVDYGRADSVPVETLQAVREHRMVKVLDDPGKADISAHVDFALLNRVAREAGAAVAGPVTQGAFLDSIGIGLRAERLRRGLSADETSGRESSHVLVALQLCRFARCSGA